MKYVLDQGKTAHAERPGQHGDEPAELVTKKVLHHQCAVRSCEHFSIPAPISCLVSISQLSQLTYEIR
jgi:hypothetical protein